MEIVLLENCRKLGAIGSVVKVKTGYAKNYLLPKKKAMRATKENMMIFEAKKDQLLARSAELKTSALELVSRLSDKTVVAIRQASPDGKLFGSVTIKDISKLFDNLGLTLNPDFVILAEPLKNLGVHSLLVSPYSGITCNILVNIARSANEAETAFAGYKSKLESEKNSTTEQY